MSETISFGDFQKLDIRIGRVKAAERVEGTDKLVKLTIDMGDEERTLVAGIADTYSPEEMIGKEIPVLANLEPKNIRGIESRGMILAVDVDGRAVLLHPDKEVPAGAKIV